MSYSTSKNFKKTSKTTRSIATILGVKINSKPANEVLREILSATNSLRLKKPLVLFTPNAEFLVCATRNPEFRYILNQSDINWSESFGLLLAAKFLGEPVKERVGGATLVKELLKIGNKEKWTIGIVGVRRGDKIETAVLLKSLKKNYPEIVFFNLDDSGFKIKNLKFNIVLACHGMVRQEKWILENKDKIKANVFMGVGGSLDFLTGFTKRAPVWVQKAGLEWFWRGLTKPGHWKRVWTAVGVFPWLVFKEKFQKPNPKQFEN